MTTTCEHGRERATCPECGVLSAAGIASIAAPALKAAADFEEQQAKVKAMLDVVAPMRPLTDVEEKWVRMKHPEMSESELTALIAEGLPADVEPITRADLPTAEPNPQHYWERDEWERKRRARKTARQSQRRNRAKKHRAKR